MRIIKTMKRQTLNMTIKKCEMSDKEYDNKECHDVIDENEIAELDLES